jgi:hypothetical protein
MDGVYVQRRRVGAAIVGKVWWGIVLRSCCGRGVSFQVYVRLEDCSKSVFGGNHMYVHW